jgi:hypothetical protein
MAVQGNKVSKLFSNKGAHRETIMWHKFRVRSQLLGTTQEAIEQDSCRWGQSKSIHPGLPAGQQIDLDHPRRSANRRLGGAFPLSDLPVVVRLSQT